MILSDREIRAAISRRAISLTPEPGLESWSSTAVDLQLADAISVWKRPAVAGVQTPVMPADSGYNYGDLQRDFGESLTLTAAGYVVTSGSFLLAWTVERIKLPHRSRVAARVEGKSSLARLGLGVHVTAPTIHAGFGYKSDDDGFPGNPIQLEIWNVGPLDIKIVAGMPICQIIFETVDGTPEKGYEGRFAVQGPSPTGK